MDVAIVTNSPGELAGWVMPVAKQITGDSRFLASRDRLVIFTPHCQYASGKEQEIAKSIPGVVKVFGPNDYLKFLFFNKGLKNGFSENGILIHMGSDYFNSFLISKRLGYPAFAYTYDVAKFYNKHFKRFFVPDQGIKDKLTSSGISIDKIDVVGDLVADSIDIRMSRGEARKSWGLEEKKILLGIFPGSRPYQVKYMVPFFLRCCELIEDEFRDVDFVLSRPSFVSEDQLKDAIINNKNDFLESTEGVFADNFITTQRGTKVRVVSEMPYEVMNACDLIMTIPGTNTAQIGVVGCPMLVVAPLNKPEEIPLDGIAGYIQYIPLIGKSIKAYLVRKFSKSLFFTAIPNRRAKKEIAMEIRGVLTPEDVKTKIVKLLTDDAVRASMSAELKKVMGGRGAAKKIADTVLNCRLG